MIYVFYILCLCLSVGFPSHAMAQLSKAKNVNTDEDLPLKGLLAPYINILPIQEIIIDYCSKKEFKLHRVIYHGPSLPLPAQRLENYGMRCIAFADKQRIIAGGAHCFERQNQNSDDQGPTGGLMCAWDIATGKQTWQNDSNYYVLSIDISHDGQYIAIGDFQGFGLYDTKTNKLVNGRIADQVRMVKITQDTRFVFWGDYKKLRVIKIDGDERNPRAIRRPPGGETTHFMIAHECLAISPSTNTANILIATYNGVDKIELHQMEEDPRKLRHLDTFPNANSPCNALLFSPEGNSLIAGHGNGIAYWNLEPTKSESAITQGFLYHPGGVNALAASSQKGSMLVSAGNESIKVWDLKNWSCLQTLAGFQSCIRSLAFAWDQKMIVAGSQEGRICVYTYKRTADIQLEEAHTARELQQPCQSSCVIS